MLEWPRLQLEFTHGPLFLDPMGRGAPLSKTCKEHLYLLSLFAALDSLGFGSYREEAEAVLQEAKAVAAKKRRASSKLENLGIPEEELLRQQQALFAKVRTIPNHILEESRLR